MTTGEALRGCRTFVLFCVGGWLGIALGANPPLEEVWRVCVLWALPTLISLALLFVLSTDVKP